ncbi:MAG: enoyl-CoA hydratase/isomerase family protein [Candidatus Helarchaeota archaeon]
MYKFKTLLFETNEKGIGIITLNRPEKLNAISFRMIEELHDLLDDLQVNLDCRVIILRGIGRAFSAGLDLKEASYFVSKKKPKELQKFYFMQVPDKIKAKAYFLWRISHLTVKMRKISQPIISMINGIASGGGFALTMATDIRIASENSKFNNAFIKIGVTGGDLGSSYMLPRLIGSSRATEIIYTGRFVDAKEAERIGFISKVVKEDKLLETALEMAGQMLKASPLGLRMTKEVLNLSMDAPSLETLIQLENRAQAICMTSKDVVEGTLAWYDRRDPKYSKR